MPTFHVPGFKVLLGASGGFCPTQLTIPSSTSFYELHGQCLSTPYLVRFANLIHIQISQMYNFFKPFSDCPVRDPHAAQGLLDTT